MENEPTSNNIIEFTEDAFMYEKKHVNPLLEPKLSTIQLVMFWEIYFTVTSDSRYH